MKTGFARKKYYQGTGRKESYGRKIRWNSEQHERICEHAMATPREHAYAHGIFVEGRTVSQFAKDIGLSRSTVYEVINPITQAARELKFI